MTRKSPILRSMLAFALAAGACAPALAHKLIAAGEVVEVAKSDLRATPAIDWNKLKQRTGRDAETWTLDGELLNDLTFYGGVDEGKTLFKEVDKRNRPLPKFSGTMLLTDIPAMLESSYRIARDVTIFEMTNAAPTTFAGHNGVRFTYDFVGPDGVRRRGEASAAIIGGKLYMSSFEAPVLYFFDRSVEDYRRVLASLSLAKSGR